MTVRRPTARITTTIRLEPTLYEALQEIAEKDVRSVNNLIEYALTKFVEEHQSSS